ncbi:hypothetical protein QC764_403300 [Podospora pseudoanserina]|uniref:Rhodopsin domain-containing protein n=1 Tax=Podospora pseudoanserina TaxID=2609844 RepID=A0ABR0I9K6_9PEZI|nr:hypothetical protein QC764_403300 [Podospora pseudoanserina]
MAAQIGLTEPGHTKFNLTFPLLQPSSNITPPSTTDDASSPSPPQNIIPGILFGILTPHIIGTLFLLSRLFSRLFLLKKWFWWEDTLILSSFLFSTAVCATYTITTTTTSFPTTHHDRHYTLRTYLALIFYQLSLCLTKLSILSFYLRIFSSCASTRRLRLLTVLTIIAVMCYGIPLLFITIFQCHPLPGLFFNSPTAVPHCFDFKPLLIASTSLHTATDVWLIMLIIPVIVRLQIPPRERAILGVVLSLGVFVAVASLTRLQLSLKAGGYIHTHHSGGDDDDEDEGVEVANTLAFFVMTVLELDVAVICACAPGVGVLMRRVWPGFLGGGGRGDTDTSDTEGGSLDLGTMRVVDGEGGKSVTELYFAGENGEVREPPALLISNHRTPHTTTLSLRSFISGLGPPRSRGKGVEGRREGRGLLLREDFTTCDDMETPTTTRMSEVGLEGCCDQYSVGFDRGQPPAAGEQTTPEKKRRCGGRRYSGRWGDSQESFVLGLNDPNSPSRLTPVDRVRKGEGNRQGEKNA